jgi:hypothetical protein
MSDFEALAAKRDGKFLVYGDSDKKWDALPDELIAAI